jgi:predicted aldo/keto reductase-like oxidoreductase
MLILPRPCAGQTVGSDDRSGQEQNKDMIPTQPFGRTGHDSTRVIFGAAALSAVTQEEADQTMELIVASGVNHIDVAASYGEAEQRLGPFLAEHRADFYLATKTGERTADAAYAEINRSLEKLRTDHVDLLQLHNLVDEAEWQTAYAPGGVLEAAVRAKDEGLVRDLGVTGHGVTVARQHLRSLQEYDFASVLLPYNFPMSHNAAYMADFEELAAVCAERNVAIQTIKSITKAAWDKEGERFAATWYEPLTDQDAIDIAVGWVLGRPGLFLDTVGDIHLLPKVLDAASRFTTRPTEEQMAQLEAALGMAPLFV